MTQADLLCWLFPAFLIGIWPTGSLLMSVFGGWGSLSAKYPVPAIFEESVRGTGSVWLGFCKYNNCVTMMRSESGVRLSMFILLRLGHPPIFIPWSDMKNGRIEGMFWWKRVRCDIAGRANCSVLFPVKLFFDAGTPMTPVPVAGI